MTTRRYPRTLNEAFPTGTTYAASIERSRRRDRSGIWIVIGCAALMALPWLVLAVQP